MRVNKGMGGMEKGSKLQPAQTVLSHMYGDNESVLMAGIRVKLSASVTAECSCPKADCKAVDKSG